MKIYLHRVNFCFFQYGLFTTLQVLCHSSRDSGTLIQRAYGTSAVTRLTHSEPAFLSRNSFHSYHFFLSVTLTTCARVIFQALKFLFNISAYASYNIYLLYASCILPIMTYACPIWGFACRTSMTILVNYIKIVVAWFIKSLVIYALSLFVETFMLPPSGNGLSNFPLYFTKIFISFFIKYLLSYPIKKITKDQNIP